MTEPAMIISMPTIARSQQPYDHRLRNLVQRTGDVTVATDLGVPRSTARGPLTVDQLPDRTATRLHIRGCSPESGKSQVPRVERENAAWEQSRCAFQLVAACLTRTRAGQCRMSAEIARLLFWGMRTGFHY